ncbi:decapping and exoribonuclease protein-like [Mytilus galloprovincialis]|uniref:decapping and exoribonuclease protein-like n=1 Tax=Mytilus galloprovincialis TaxID=29158 RepID=UPI003F7C00DF
MKRTVDYREREKLQSDTETENKSVSFRTHPTNRFDRKPPVFRKPNEIGNYSVDKNRLFNTNRSNMKYFIPPRNPNNVNFDLTIGYKEMIRKDESKKEYLDFILRWILCNKSKFQLQTKDGNNQNNRDLHTDFICWRGLLTKLLCTPYENRDDWLIAITKYNNTIYMCEFETEHRKKNKADMTERQDEMSCWGWKFEQYVTADKPDGSPVTTEPVNNNEEYSTVVRSRLESHSLVFSGEVDAIDTTSGCEGCKYVEFKTNREIEYNRQRQNFQRFKLIKWWAQSYLVGIPKIVCGYRDDDGIVHRLETINTLDIPNQLQEMRDPWKPNVSLNFLDQLLAFIKANVTEDNPRLVYLMSWKPGSDVQLQKQPTNSGEYQFLPDWYTTNVPEEEPDTKKMKMAEPTSEKLSNPVDRIMTPGK